MSGNAALEGRRILIVEDNLFAAMELEQAVLAMGGEAVGPVPRLRDALALAQAESLHGAVLDVDLRGELVFPVAEELERRRVPMLFASGFDDGLLFPPRFAQRPRLRKPYTQGELHRLLGELFAAA